MIHFEIRVFKTVLNIEVSTAAAGNISKKDSPLTCAFHQILIFLFERTLLYLPNFHKIHKNRKLSFLYNGLIYLLSSL